MRETFTLHHGLGYATHRQPLLNPETRTLEVLRLQGGDWVVAAVHTGETPVRAEPFETVALDFETLWGETEG